MAIKLEDLIPGGKADNLSKKGVNVYELQKGIKVEMEHTNSKAKAEEIARDHLAEDPEYYSKLEKAGLADELYESKVGDMYITIGETIENMYKLYKKLEKLLKYYTEPKTNDKSVALNLKKIETALYDLKKILGDSYDFGIDRSGRKTKFNKFDVTDLINELDNISTFRQYKNEYAEYDDPIYLDIPYSLLDKYGFSKKILEKIQDNTYEYGPGISFNNKKNSITIYGAND